MERSRDSVLNQIRSSIRQMKLSDDSLPLDWRDQSLRQVPSFPTPSLAVNYAIGVGGVPKGRIIEIFGGESSGKTTLGCQIAAEALAQGEFVGIVDVAHALDPRYTRNLGLPIDDENAPVFICQPPDGEEALAVVAAMAKSGVKLIMLDDVASLVSKEELEKGMDGGHASVAIQARMMARMLRQLTGVLSRNGTTLLCLNQIREKVGVVYGNPETTPGGRALKYFASVRIDMRTKKRGSDTDPQLTRVRIVKNKVAPPYRDCEIQIVPGVGIDRNYDAVVFARDNNLVKRKGGWMTLPRLECAGMADVPKDTDLKFNGPEKAAIFVDQTDGYLAAFRTWCLDKMKEKR